MSLFNNPGFTILTNFSYINNIFIIFNNSFYII